MKYGTILICGSGRRNFRQFSEPVGVGLLGFNPTKDFSFLLKQCIEIL